MRPAALNLIGALTLLSNLMAGPATAWDRQVKQGETLARTNCARCHAVGRVGGSPLLAAPPFRELHMRYPVEDLGEALAEVEHTVGRTVTN